MSPSHPAAPGSTAEPREASTPALSIVIPALNEAGGLPRLLACFDALRSEHEIIVVDGGSGDGTPDVAGRAGARVAFSARGRGTQLAAGAALARARWLFFVHADATLPTEAVRALEAAVADDTEDTVFVFRLRIAGDRLSYRLIERAIAWRTRWGKLPYGDQGLLVSRTAYDAAGGFAPVALMEDVALARALGRRCRLRLLTASIIVSDRRWRREGVLRATARNWSLLLRYLFGTPPERLVRHYPPEVGDDAAG